MDAVVNEVVKKNLLRKMDMPDFFSSGLMQSRQTSLVSLWAAADSMNFVLRKHSLDTVAPLTYYGFTTSPAGDFWDGPKVDSNQGCWMTPFCIISQFSQPQVV
jgi:hypothetical protein